MQPELDKTKAELDKFNTPSPEQLQSMSEHANLQDDKFVAFLAEYPDAETFDMKNQDELDARHEAFKNKEKVAEDLRKIYKEKFEKESGLKLDDKTFEDVDAYVNKLAIENPGQMGDLVNSIDHFTNNQAKIGSLESEIQELGGLEKVRETLEEQRKVLIEEHTILKGAGFLQRLFHRDVELPGNEGVRIKKSNILELIEAYNKQADTYKDVKTGIETFKDQLEKAKQEILGELGPVQAIREKVQDKLKKKFEDLLDPQKIDKVKLKDLEAAKAQYDQLKGSDSDLLPEDFELNFETALENKVAEEIGKAIDVAFKKKNKYIELTKAINEFTNRDQIAGKTGEDVKEFVIGVLEKVRDSLPSDSAGKQKKILINGYLATLGK